MHAIHNTTDKAGSGQAEGAVGKLEKGSDESAALWQAIFAAMGQTASPVPQTDPAGAGGDRPVPADTVDTTTTIAPAIPCENPSIAGRSVNLLPPKGMPLTAQLLSTPTNNDATATGDVPVAADTDFAADGIIDSAAAAVDVMPAALLPGDGLTGDTFVADASAPAVPLANLTTPVQARSLVRPPVAEATPTQSTAVESDQPAPDQRLPELIAAGPDIIPGYLQAQAVTPKPRAWESAGRSVISPKTPEVAVNAATVSSDESQPIIATDQANGVEQVDPVQWVRQVSASDVGNMQQNTRVTATTSRQTQAGKASPIIDGLLNRVEVTADARTQAADAEAALPAPVVTRAANVERAAELHKALTLSGVTNDVTSAAAPVNAPKQVNDAAQRRQPVGQQVVQAFTAGPARIGQQVSIRLDPPDMGSVKLTLKTDRGEIRGVVEVDNARTLAELKSETPSLLSRLSDSGVQVRGMEFVLTHDGSGQQSAYAGFGDRHDGGRQQADTGGRNYNEQPDVEPPIRSTMAGEVVDNEAINIWV